MPYKTRKIRGKNCYNVYKPSTKRVFAKCTTKENAKKQMRLLRAIQFNKKFTPLSKRGSKKNNRTQKKHR